VSGERTVSGGERERYEALFREHYPAVYRYGARRVGVVAAADVAAEVFLVAWRRRGELQAQHRGVSQGERETLVWLLGVARRVCANHLRSRGRRLALGERLAAERDAGVSLSPDVVVGEGFDGGGEIEDRVRRALCSLRADDRELLAMIAWDGLQNREAAVVLGCSPRTLAVRLHRARRRLALALAAQASEQSGAGCGAEGVVGHEAC
jgi:RNA polymerase sigma-70 factor, ECF subfamily